MSMERRFFAEIWDSTGSYPVGSPVLEVISCNVTKRVDGAGEFSATFPATAQQVRDLLQANRRVVIKEVDSDNAITAPAVVEGIVQRITKVAQDNAPIWTATGLDRMGELNYINTQRARTYDNVATANIIGTTASGTGLLRATGWTPGSVSASVTPTTVQFERQSILNALITLAKSTGDHIREGATARTLDYGTFGGDSVCRLTNVDAVRSGLQGAFNNLALIAQISVTDISADIENRIYPQGASDFDLRDAPTTITDIIVAASRGPLGATTTVSAGGAAATTVNVNSVVGFAADQEIFIGDADDWTADHEMALIQSVGATSLTVYETLANTYASGADVLQNPQFYIEDTASQATYGLRESTPAFGWIGPGEGQGDPTVQRQAAATLYNAASARLTRYKDNYETYALGGVLGLPLSVRPGDKVQVTYRGIVEYFGSEFWADIDQDMFVLSITRTYEGTGAVVTALEVASVLRPTPNNVNLLVYNLDMLNYITPR